MSLCEKLQTEIVSLEQKIDGGTKEIENLALDAELNSTIAKKRDAKQKKLEALKIKYAHKVSALRIAHKRQNETEIAAAEAARQERARDGITEMRKALEGGEQIQAGFKLVREGYDAFQDHKAKSCAILREVGLVNLSRSLGRETKGMTLKHVLVATAPEAARHLGLPLFASGGTTGSFGLIDAIQRSDFESWDKLPADDLSHNYTGGA